MIDSIYELTDAERDPALRKPQLSRVLSSYIGIARKNRLKGTDDTIVILWFATATERVTSSTGLKAVVSALGGEIYDSGHQFCNRYFQWQ